MKKFRHGKKRAVHVVVIIEAFHDASPHLKATRELLLPTKPHLGGRLRRWSWKVGRARCAGPGGASTGGSSGSQMPATCKAPKMAARVPRALRARNEQPRQQAAVENAKQVPTGSTGIDLAASGGAGALQQLASAPEIDVTSLARHEMERWGQGKRTSAAVCGAGAAK